MTTHGTPTAGKSLWRNAYDAGVFGECLVSKLLRRAWMTAGSGSPTPSPVADQLPARGRLSSFKHPFDGLPNRATVATWLANPGGIEPVMAVGVMKPTGMASAAM